VKIFDGRSGPVQSAQDILTPEPAILPSPRPRLRLEEGGGPPWERSTSTRMEASLYRRAKETTKARAAGVASGWLAQARKAELERRASLEVTAS